MDAREARTRANLARFIAAGFYVFAGVMAFGLALLTLRTPITPRHVMLLGGFTVLLVGWGGVFAEQATTPVPAARHSRAFKIVLAGAGTMLTAFAFA